jgi:CheY-like chemotaxis protein
VVAVQGEATRELIRDLLTAAGFGVIEVTTGSDTLARVSDARPALVLVDVGLPDMMGFQVSEAIRRDPANAAMKIVLVAAIHNKDRYRRPPDNLFGADDYIERHEIEARLVEKIKQLCGGGTTAGPAPAKTTPEAEPAPPGTPRAGRSGPAAVPPSGPATAPAKAVPATQPLPGAQTAQAAHEPAAPPPISKPKPPATTPAAAEGAGAPPPPPKAENPAQEAALRLARIIVSDIALYNAKKVDEGVMNGTFFELLRAEIEEGRKLYEERKGPGLATSSDLFQQTLEQFVATRRELLKRNRAAAA